jgi:hypothetical protein
MKVYRYIAILLLICFSAFLGHNLVPHHHHSETLLSPIAADCPIEHEDHHCCDQDADGEDQHQDQHPSHCHAFNDVVFQKYRTQLVMPESGFTLVFAVPHSDLIPDPEENNEFYCSKDLTFPIKTIELYGSRGLRGPPRTV